MSLESRTGKDLSSTYPEVRDAVAAQHPRELLLDGEVVAYDGDQTSFTRLQQRLGAARPSTEQMAEYPVVYCLFDLLEIDGEDLTDRPLVERRARLMSTVLVQFGLAVLRGLARRLGAPLCRGLPVGLGGADREAGRRALCRRSLQGLVEVEVRLGAGVRHRRVHRPERQPHRLWSPARRLLRTGIPPLRRKGRHRLHQGDTPRPWRSAARARHG